MAIQEMNIDSPSDELCDGDRDDDRELEDEEDPEDPIVEDRGFSHLWVQTKDQDDDTAKYSDQLANGDRDDDKEIEDVNDPEDMITDDHGFNHLWMQTKYEVSSPADELCDGDKDDNKELEDVDDPEDMIVDDTGFSHQLLMTGEENMDEGEANKKTKFSDELCYGDKDDDKELEDERDGKDYVVDINGYL